MTLRLFSCTALCVLTAAISLAAPTEATHQAVPVSRIAPRDLSPAAGQPAQAIDAASTNVVDVEVGKGQMLRLSQPAASVIVADPEVADIQVVSPRTVFVHGKRVGETSLIAIDSSDATILNVTIDVTHNISKLNRALKEVMPDADVSFRSINGGLVMSGDVDSPLQAETIRNLAGSMVGEDGTVVNMVNTLGADQVMIRVKVLEVSRNELKRFGINIQELLSEGNFTFQLLQGRALTTSAGLISRNSSDNSIYLRRATSRFDTSAVIDALETDDMVTVLSEPSLTTISGKTANFLAGGQFPIPMADADGEISIVYRPFGVNLSFTPVVLNKDRISLTVAPEVSDISETNSVTVGSVTTYAVPTLTTQRVETTVELGSGQSFAIAGMLKNRRNHSVDKFPGLGELPILGNLFRSQSYQNDQTELVVLVTPYIVRPVSAKLMTPLDGMEPAGELRRLFAGHMYVPSSPPDDETTFDAEAIPATEPTEETMPLHGQAGFILE